MIIIELLSHYVTAPLYRTRSTKFDEILRFAQGWTNAGNIRDVNTVSVFRTPQSLRDSSSLSNEEHQV